MKAVENRPYVNPFQQTSSEGGEGDHLDENPDNLKSTSMNIEMVAWPLFHCENNCTYYNKIGLKIWTNPATSSHGGTLSLTLIQPQCHGIG